MSIEMTEEQRDMFDRLTPLQQKVCTNILLGMNNTEAYRAAGGKATGDGERSKASQIVTNSNVKLFLDSIKQSSVSEAIMSREEMMKVLSDLSRINVSDLLTSDISVLTEFKGGYDLKLKASLSAMAQLAKIAGYDAPQKIEGEVSVKVISDEKLKEELGKLGYGRESNQLIGKAIDE